jgi:alkylation response protein AidB-like acyl-CoA dehydrogenase
MDFSLNQDQRLLKDTLTKFSRQELNIDLAGRDDRAEFGFEGWKKCAEIGILGLAMPQKFGGSETEMTSVAVAMESLGYGCQDNGLLFALGAQMWSVQMPLLLFGNEAQKDRYLPRLISGGLIGAHAVTEPGSGSDVYSLQTTAKRDGRHFVLNGTKTFVTSSTVADLFLVLATTDLNKGARGLTAFLIDKGAAGLTATRRFEKMGLRTSVLGEVVLEDCRVSQDQMLGTEGEASMVFASAMEWERAFLLAPAIGTMERQIEQCVHYACTRQQFGKAIGKNQSVANRIVDMQVRLETARLLQYRTAWIKQTGKRLTREPSETKLYLSESWVQTSLDAMAIHGGYGYMVESGIERDVRDALASRIYSGTSDIQKVIIARYLGL